MRKLIIAAAATSVAGLAAAQSASVKTPADAFKAGQDFSNGAKGKGAASGSVSSTSGAANVPKYNTNPPQSSIFQGGKNLISADGDGKVAGCKTSVAGNAYDQQECDAVNYLNKMDRTNKFTIDKKTDPIMVQSQTIIKAPGEIPASTTAACHIETTPVPGTFTTQTCEESTVLTSFACKKTLLPQCGYVGTTIKEHTESKAGAFVYSTLTDSGTPGLYNYNIEVPYRNCGGDGTADISFNLDTVGFGGYITIDLSNLDDATAIGVNGTTVFAGHPNSGPIYNGDYFPVSRHDFVREYSWSEDVGMDQCVERDPLGACTKSQHIATMANFFANTKLLDYCPSGYGPMSMKGYATCDPASGTCTAPDGYTPSYIGGFFCNSEGKFLMNRHEGIGTWGGSVNATMPLKVGTNTISVYWGTGAWGKACGNVRVSGQIYNVAPGCSVRWDDQCAPARNALKVAP